MDNALRYVPYLLLDSLHFLILNFDLYFQGGGWNALLNNVLTARSFLKSLQPFFNRILRCLQPAENLLQNWMFLSLITMALLSMIQPVPPHLCLRFNTNERALYSSNPIFQGRKETTIFVERISLTRSYRYPCTKATKDE